MLTFAIMEKGEEAEIDLKLIVQLLSSKILAEINYSYIMSSYFRFYFLLEEGKVCFS